MRRVGKEGLAYGCGLTVSLCDRQTHWLKGRGQGIDRGEERGGDVPVIVSSDVGNVEEKARVREEDK